MGEENEKLHNQFKRKAPDSSDVIRFYFAELFFLGNHLTPREKILGRFYFGKDD